MKTELKTESGYALSADELQSINGGVYWKLIGDWVMFLVEHGEAYVEGVKEAANEMYTTIYGE